MILQNYQNFTEMYHLLWTTNRNLEYCISANSLRGNYSFLKLTLCTVTFDHSTYRCGNYSREETIQGRKLFAEIRYSHQFRSSGSHHQRPQIELQVQILFFHRPTCQMKQWLCNSIYENMINIFYEKCIKFQIKNTDTKRFFHTVWLLDTLE